MPPPPPMTTTFLPSREKRLAAIVSPVASC
jgi:hypothetical protein